MADIRIEPKQSNNIAPWLIALAVVVVIVAWLVWRNNRVPTTGFYPMPDAPELAVPAPTVPTPVAA